MAANRLCPPTSASLRALIAGVVACLAFGDASWGGERILSFSAAPDSLNALTGSFVYTTPGGPSATFEGFEYVNGAGFTDGDHTGNDMGLVYGSGSGPATITFSSPVQLVD